MIEIKKLDQELWQAYRALRLEALQKEPLAFGDSYEESKDRPENVWRSRIDNFIFALDENKPAGMIGLYQEGTKSKHVINIFSVYVKKEYRGQGIGKKLMEAVLTQIKINQNIIKIKLAVNPAQEAAVKLYQSFGFKITGTFKKELCVEGKYYDELLMEKYY